MKTETRTRTVVQEYKVYIAEDGQEFESERECTHHEKLLNGTRMICPHCGGKGVEGYCEWITCPNCHGKGYLEKKVTWE